MAFSIRLENGPFHPTLNSPSRPILTLQNYDKMKYSKVAKESKVTAVMRFLILYSFQYITLYSKIIRARFPDHPEAAYAASQSGLSSVGKMNS